MSFANPTPLRTGMTGNFSGQSYRVVGRVVMGVEEGGETYYWNEFNLETGSGESATLVYEETERGGEWRLFTMFEPECPMTAEDAATKRVGDLLDFGDGQVRVTLVEDSRVYYIEGKAPEGVEVGDVARYFNAEAGETMTVVSWTGDEVEFYRGMTITREMVAAAFNLPTEALRSFFPSETAVSSSSGGAMKVVAAVFAALVCLASYSSCKSTHRPPAVVKISAPPSPLKVGSSGKLDGKNYRIVGRAIVEIARVGLLFDRHEFHLRDDDGNSALLIDGLEPGADDWCLFTPLHPLEPLTPPQAGAVRWGQTVNLDGIVAPVGEIFLSTIRQADDADLPEFKTGEVFYGFSGQTGSTLLLARWNENGTSCHQGKRLPKAVIAAFGKPAGK